MSHFEDLCAYEQDAIDNEIQSDEEQEDEEYRAEMLRSVKKAADEYDQRNKMIDFFIRLQDVHGKAAPSTDSLFLWAREDCISSSNHMQTVLKETYGLHGDLNLYISYAEDFMNFFPTIYDENVISSKDSIAVRFFNYYK